MNEISTINLNNSKTFLFSKNKDYSFILEDKIFELGVNEYKTFNDEDLFIGSLNQECADSIIMFFSSFDRSTMKLLKRVKEKCSSLQLIVIALDKVSLDEEFETVLFDTFIRIKNKRKPAEYSPISVEACSNLSIAPCDIYVQISDEKYLKLFNKYENLTLVDLEKYNKESKDYLFVQSKDLGHLHEKVIEIMAQNVNAGLTVEELSYVSLIIERLVPFSIALNVPHKLLDDVVDCHLDVFREINATPKVKATYSELMEVPSRMTHVSLSSLISSVIIKQVDWGTKSIQKKIIKCGLFCDFSLVEKDFKFNTNSGVDYRNHPLRSARVLEEMPFIDNDIISMVEQHHEQGDGSGFPRGLSSHQISKMSCVFILSEFITKRLVSRKESNSELFLNILKQVPQENTENNFEDSFKVLRNLYTEDIDKNS